MTAIRVKNAYLDDFVIDVFSKSQCCLAEQSIFIEYDVFCSSILSAEAMGGLETDAHRVFLVGCQS